MLRKILAVAAFSALAAPVTAAVPTFNISATATSAVASGNEYRDALGAVGLTDVARGATVGVSGRGKVTYTYVGSESGLVDTFTDGSVGPFAETNPGVGTFSPIVQRPFAPVAMGSTVYPAAGSFTGSFLSGAGDLIAPGDIRFAVFSPGTSSFSASTIYFSLDDRRQGDGDFDDFIVKASIGAVPEPATWAMMIGGFGLVGAVARRRRSLVVAA